MAIARVNSRGTRQLEVEHNVRDYLDEGVIRIERGKSGR